MNEQQQLQSAGAGDVTLKQLAHRVEVLTSERDAALDRERRALQQLEESEAEACRLEQRCIALEKVANKAEANAKEERARRHENEKFWNEQCELREKARREREAKLDQADTALANMSGALHDCFPTLVVPHDERFYGAALREAVKEERARRHDAEGEANDEREGKRAEAWHVDMLIAELAAIRAALGVGEDADLVEAAARKMLLIDQLRARLSEMEAKWNTYGGEARARENDQLRARLAECERERDEARGIAGDDMALLGQSQAAEQDLAARVERAREALSTIDATGGAYWKQRVRSALAALTAAPAVEPAVKTCKRCNPPGWVACSDGYTRKLGDAMGMGFMLLEAAPAEAPKAPTDREVFNAISNEHPTWTAADVRREMEARRSPHPADPHCMCDACHRARIDAEAPKRIIVGGYSHDGPSHPHEIEVEATKAESPGDMLKCRRVPRAEAPGREGPGERDESVPPPGWRHAEFNGGCIGSASDSPYACRLSGGSVRIAEAWRIYDAEHGYAPAAPASEPALPEGWTHHREMADDGVAYDDYKTKRRTVTVFYDDTVDARGLTLTATELHAVLAHHLATRKATR